MVLQPLMADISYTRTNSRNTAHALGLVLWIATLACCIKQARAFGFKDVQAGPLKPAGISKSCEYTVCPAGPVGPQGPAGPIGPMGPPGYPGPAGMYCQQPAFYSDQSNSTSIIRGVEQAKVRAYCQTGYLLSGECATYALINNRLMAEGIFPLSKVSIVPYINEPGADANYVHCIGIKTSASDLNLVVVAVAYCCKDVNSGAMSAKMAKVAKARIIAKAKSTAAVTRMWPV